MRPTYEDVVILVIAHPDDESMFFFPTLARLSAERPVHILCLSDGGYDGCGPARDRAAEPWLVRGTPPSPGAPARNVFRRDAVWGNSFGCGGPAPPRRRGVGCLRRCGGGAARHRSFLRRERLLSTMRRDI
mmetsp:Transcript_1504/g.4848  ORF Transcript_1504/g.4848 Transcript_1504/m.4848 type:complete len:131 (+) Transcript_1504:68-460(+)